MVHDPSALVFDVATALSKGACDHQEDAVIADFSRGSEIGFTVLADGMGGHAAGDIASKTVVSTLFTELMFKRGDVADFAQDVQGNLKRAAQSANAALQDYIDDHPAASGMGATLLTSVILRGQLYWLSVGDSPLFLFRNGTLVQLNDDHSLAPQIDLMVKTGMMDAELGKTHPDRNILTSALGNEEIPKIDCPDDPLVLQPGDTVIAASDGLQFLSEDRIEELLSDHPLGRCEQIADLLLDQLHSLDDPDLDNISLSIIQVRRASQNYGAEPLKTAGNVSPIRRLFGAAKWADEFEHQETERARKAI